MQLIVLKLMSDYATVFILRILYLLNYYNYMWYNHIKQMHGKQYLSVQKTQIFMYPIHTNICVVITHQKWRIF